VAINFIIRFIGDDMKPDENGQVIEIPNAFLEGKSFEITVDGVGFLIIRHWASTLSLNPENIRQINLDVIKALQQPEVVQRLINKNIDHEDPDQRIVDFRRSVTLNIALAKAARRFKTAWLSNNITARVSVVSRPVKPWHRTRQLGLVTPQDPNQ
jgi:hypothetical protein